MVVAYRFPPSEMEPVLVARARAGDDEAFSELMGEYGETVRRLVRRFVTDSDDASDVEQETWIRAFSKLDSLRDVHRFRPWLKSIARNSALTFVSGRSKQRAHVRTFHTYEDDEVEEFEDLSEPTPEAYTLSRDNRRKICEALGSLSQTDRDVLDMRERLRLDYDEIALKLGISRNAAEVRVCRARDRFRRIFDVVEEKQSRCGTNPLLISELIDAELDEAAARDVRAHIKSCQECDERFVTMQAGQAVYRNWGGLAMPGLTGGGLLGFLAEATHRVLAFLGLGGGGAAATATTVGASGAGGAAVATVAATSAIGTGLSAVVVTLIATTTIAGGAMLPVDRPPHVSESQPAVALSASFVAPSLQEAAVALLPLETPPAALVAEVEAAVESPLTPAVEFVALTEGTPEIVTPVEEVTFPDVDPSVSVSPGPSMLPEPPAAAVAPVAVAANHGAHVPVASGTGSPSEPARAAAASAPSAPSAPRQTRLDSPPAHAATTGRQGPDALGLASSPGNAPIEVAAKANGSNGYGVARGRAAETGPGDLGPSGLSPVTSQGSAAIMASPQHPSGQDSPNAGPASDRAVGAQSAGHAGDPPAHAGVGNGNGNPGHGNGQGTGGDGKDNGRGR